MKRKASRWRHALGLALLAATMGGSASHAAVVDCSKLKNVKCHNEFSADSSKSHVDNYMDPKDVQQCILRGYDAPASCRNKEGKSPGVRVEGSSGFSYGAIQAPENSPGKTNASPSISLGNIRLNLGFDWKAGCKIFGINICADGKNPPAPLPTKAEEDRTGAIPEEERCPEKLDPDNRIGAKQALTPGTTTLDCGGAVPVTNYETTLNAKPNHIVVTEYRSYEMRVYQKYNGKYVLNPFYYLEYTEPNHPWFRDMNPFPPKIRRCLLCREEIDLPEMELSTKRVLMRSTTGAIPLPGYLCNSLIVPTPNDGPLPKYLKSVELTPTIAQMITYDNLDSINLRLMSRNTIKHDSYPMALFGIPPIRYYFAPEPPEEEIEEDEKFLILSTFNGLPVVPAGRFPIPGAPPTQFPAPGPAGVIPSGRPPMPFLRPDIQINMGMAPPDGCAAEPFFFKKPGRLSGDVLVEQPTTLCEGTEEECEAMRKKCEEAGGEDCDTISPVPVLDESCETAKVPLKFPDVPAYCAGKMQWMVLDRHNLIYPPLTNVTPIEIDGRTSLMMPTVAKSRVFTQKDTNIRLGKDAPPITLQEGGTLMMSNGHRVKMFPPATIDMAAFPTPNGEKPVGVITLTGGGVIINEAGKLMRSIPPDTSNFLVTDPVLPYIVNVNRSFDMPKDYEIPSQSKPSKTTDPVAPPYVKLPLDAPPDSEITKVKPKPNFNIPGLGKIFRK